MNSTLILQENNISNGLELTQNNEVKVKIADNDQVLSVSENGIASEIGLDYDSDEDPKTIVLTGKNGEEISSQTLNLTTPDDVDGKISDAIDELDFTDTKETGKFVTKVDEKDGVISVTREALTPSDIPTGVSPSKIDTTFGTGNLSDDLGSLATGLTNVQNDINVINGDDITTGSIAKAAKDTLTSAKAYTDALENGQVTTNKNAIATLNGSDSTTGSVAKSIKDAIEGLDVSAETLNGATVLATVSETNGKISVTTRTLTKGDIGLGNVDNTSDANKPISTATQTALDNKVDKITGKSLSTNDYTTADKNKLNGISEGAQVNTIETIELDGTALVPDANKKVNVNYKEIFRAGINSIMGKSVSNTNIDLSTDDGVLSALSAMLQFIGFTVTE